MEHTLRTRIGSAAGMLLGALLLTSCNKDREVVPDNQAPDHFGVPTVITENYVNRLFIDLLGREPLDVEMQAEVAALESAGLSSASRIALVDKLMMSTAALADDSSYRNKYHTRQYELFKSLCLEGASDEVIDGFIANAQQQALDDSLSGNGAGLNAANSALGRLLAVKRSRTEYRDGLITINEVMRRMLLNAVYDEINMNSFNYVNATFDNLLGRFPTNAEFTVAYAMVDAGQAGLLFGQSGQNKGDYAAILTSSAEGHEGLIGWCYRTFLGRAPSSAEVFALLPGFLVDHDLKRVQRSILITDEYANI
ncbi:MAG TPA: hypothetical protein PLR96_02680 [Flavobacteriales bacterium]|nr:hypothetical protein [Flavobacteriales bacterium]